MTNNKWRTLYFTGSIRSFNRTQKEVIEYLTEAGIEDIEVRSFIKSSVPPLINYLSEPIDPPEPIDLI